MNITKWLKSYWSAYDEWYSSLSLEELYLMFIEKWWK
jgi:hypothetical protein